MTGEAQEVLLKKHVMEEVEELVLGRRAKRWLRRLLTLTSDSD